MEEQTTTVTVTYAGFWKRFAAVLIDGLILGAFNFIIAIPFIGLLGFGAVKAVDNAVQNGTDEAATQAAVGFIALVFGAAFFAMILTAVAGWLYFALMESSNTSGTLGKMAIGIKVTDMNGNKISFGKATGRYFGKIISGFILYIGFIMAGFTEKKQALHDIMAGCLVVNK